MTLREDFINTIARGLQRTSIHNCSRWAETYRVMGGSSFPGPWSFRHYPWLKDMHDSEAEINVGQKAAQMGYTETVLNITFYNIDVKNTDCLYVLPAKTPDASDFSASRFDAALELSPHLSGLFSDVKNIGHKRAGSSNLYIRGSRSRSGLKSIPVGLVVLDEVNEMTAENIPLAFERLSGQLTKAVWLISTPTLDGVGINKYFKESSQNHYYFKCISCSRFIELKFPESLMITGEHMHDKGIKNSYLKCEYCQAILPHQNKIEWLSSAKWIESYDDRDMKGWHISQLYSPTITPESLAVSYFRSLSDPTEEQEFFNSKLGLTKEIEGSRITEAQIEATKKNYVKYFSSESSLITMGVDVGYPNIHFEIDEWILQGSYGSDINTYAHCKLLNNATVKEFEDLDKLMINFNINFCVIDAHPERRKAYAFASRFWGRVRLAFYGTGITGKQIHISQDLDDPTLTVDRTSWLDLSLGRFKNGSISLPVNIDYEYRSHIKALVRVYKKDKDGNPVGSYVHTSADHFAHARNYSEIALPMAASIGHSSNLGNII